MSPDLEDLAKGVSLSTSVGGEATVSYIEFVDRIAALYNFSVERAHTYYVGENEVLVHNACKTPIPRSRAARNQYLRGLAESGNAPKWMNQWLTKGKVPPGYHVDHIKPLFQRGPDIPSNMRLKSIKDHINRHRYLRPGGKFGG